VLPQVGYEQFATTATAELPLPTAAVPPPARRAELPRVAADGFAAASGKGAPDRSAGRHSDRRRRRPALHTTPTLGNLS
jgi:hypothetical protein